jgi:hypothetical protein
MHVITIEKHIPLPFCFPLPWIWWMHITIFFHFFLLLQDCTINASSLMLQYICGLPTFFPSVWTFDSTGRCMKLNMVSEQRSWVQVSAFTALSSHTEIQFTCRPDQATRERGYYSICGLPTFFPSVCTFFWERRFRLLVLLVGAWNLITNTFVLYGVGA